MSPGYKSSFFHLSQSSHTELLYVCEGFSAMWKDKSQPSKFAGIASQKDELDNCYGNQEWILKTETFFFF